jgi:hypothetical protein
MIAAAPLLVGWSLVPFFLAQDALPASCPGGVPVIAREVHHCILII